MPTDSDALFRILADPTRRQILDLLAERGPLTVSELAGEFPRLVTSGISKHLMSLRGASLVASTRRGREQVYQLKPDVLAAALTPWIAKYERYWSRALGRLRDLAEESASKDTGIPSKNATRRRK
jgi:DNA-binding transcriptional ArsR family regulator